MKFTGAMNAIRKGKKVTRDGKTTIVMTDDNKMMRIRGKKETEARFTQSDIEGEWNVVKEVTVKAVAKKKAVKKKKKAA
jgi:hypothetical protein